MRRLVRAALACVPLLPHVASAQGPWAPSLTVGRKTLGTGECSAVALTLIDAKTKEWPRGPNGNRVSLADFDFAVSAPVERAAVGQYDGPTSFAMCACPKAPGGTIATVTATYPGKFIAPKARVPEVSFAVTTTEPIVAGTSSGNPPGCDPPTPTTALEGGRAVWTVTLAPPVAIPIGSCSAVPLTLRDSSGKDWPRTPLGARVALADFDFSATAANGADVVGTYDGSSSLMACACKSGTVGETATVTATYPARALAAKARVPGVALRASAPFALAAARGSANPAGCAQAQVAQVGHATDAGKSLADATPMQRVDPSMPIAPNVARGPTPELRAPIAAAPASGRSPIAHSGDSTSPPIVNPSGFTATPLGGGSVRLDWQSVPGAVNYRVDGSGIPAGGMMHNGSTTITLYQVPSGPDSWTIRTMYPGDVSDSTTAPVATAMLRAVPPHQMLWLTKNNGAGNSALASAHYSTLCPPTVPDCFTALESVIKGSQFAANDIPFWGDPTGERLAEEAVYGNITDLGFGRRTNCSQVMKGPPVPGPVTMCYTTSHGPAPGEAGFANAQIITRAAAGELGPAQDGSQTMLKNPWGDSPRSGTVIIKDAAGAFYFYAFTPGQWDLGVNTDEAFYNKWIVTPGLQSSLTLDSEGAKSVPHSCLSCHGGQWNAATHRVTGSSFLPLDPSSLVFGTNQPNDRANYTRGGQEENIRRINQIIASASVGSAVASYINGLYNGSANTKGAVARTDYVPSGWSAQTGFYLSTVRPYCANCHLAAPATINFASWGNFLQNKAAIYNAVCVAHTMPHAEIPYRAFWTKDTGVLYLPGLLAATLGYPSC